MIASFIWFSRAFSFAFDVRPILARFASNLRPNRIRFTPKSRPIYAQIASDLRLIYFKFSTLCPSFQADELKDEVSRWANENQMDIAPLLTDDLSTYLARIGYQ